ncbi:histidinol phosphate phosphatase HisJ family [Caldicellulosiruptor obsidiansis OB47]|uniref:Histidinol-phosphatase n=1 Tax=Caldicellulosiruptor obsidiansis (strain ATCC BAA-2073 / JCM 16842 / OB47) TaxID=608506 RepID=D9TJK0_CALOO|nr:histidinol-phosphatase HisJ family protein [Caldicellulosiruptor obsidiansis]ADL42182.1 histidinol phosphate phosphatase HisJ family [Caldicellulosiruptor obsidiansis OB47]
MFDYHIHSNFSSDSNMSMEDAVKKAIELNLDEIAFTDHMDLLYPSVSYPVWDINYEDYMNEFYSIKEKYSNKIKIKLGSEVGLQPHSIEKSLEILNSYSFDFVIASTHVVDFQDLADGVFYQEKAKQQAYIRYFEETLNLIKSFDKFCVYGHLDIVKRYGDYENKDLDKEEYWDLIDEILKLLILKGKGIEVNTSGFRYGLGMPHPEYKIIKRFYELGGEIITLGSDAHSTEYIAYMFSYTVDMLKSIGFKYLTKFENLEPIFVKI